MTDEVQAIANTQQIATREQLTSPAIAEAGAIVQRTKYLGPVAQQNLVRFAELGLHGRRLQHLAYLFYTNNEGAGNAVKFPLETLFANAGAGMLGSMGSNVSTFESFLDYAERIAEIRQTFHDRGAGISYKSAALIERTIGERGIQLLDDLIEQCEHIDGYVNIRSVLGLYNDILKESLRTGHDPEHLLSMRMDFAPDEDKLDTFNFAQYCKDICR